MTRPLRPADRFVRVPLGLIWFGVIALVALPVLVYMTTLYYVVAGARRLRQGGRSDPGGAARTEAA